MSREGQRRADGRTVPKEALRKRKRERAAQMLYIGLVIAVVVGLYGVVWSAVDRFHWKADLTEGQIYQLTDATKDILSALDQDVAVVNCSSRSGADSNVVELLSRYEAASPRIRVEYSDLTMNPALVEECARQAITLSEDGVLVRCGGRSAFLEWEELYEIRSAADAGGNTRYSVTGFQAERRITAAIVQVTSRESIGVSFTAGHSETATDALKELVSNSGYDVDQTVLGVDAIGPNVETLVVAGGRRDFSEEEIETLDGFLAGGGNLVVFRDPEVESLPRLDAYLQEWGLTVENRIVLEPKQQLDSPLNIIPVFGVSMINVYFSQQSTYLALPECRSIALSSTNGCLTNEVLRSTSDSYGKPYANLDTLARESGDSAGPFTVAATSERSRQNADGEEEVQYVFLMASTGFYQDSYLKTGSLGNADFVLQVLSHLHDGSVSLNIPAKSLKPGEITVSWASIVVFAAVFTGILPLGLLAAGIRQFWKRRHA